MASTLRTYEKSIKWGYFSDAQSFSRQPESQELIDRYKEVKVISYEVLRREISEDFQRLTQTVEIKFFHEQQGKIKTVKDRQVWLYDEQREAWVLEGGLPDFMSATQ